MMTLHAKSYRSHRTAFGLVFVILLLFCRTTFAQDAKRPIARLITANSTTPRIRPASISTTKLSSPTVDEASSIERRAFDQTNLIRRQNGLPPLTWDAGLCLMARNHSATMARLKFFSHSTPEGNRLKDRARAAGILHFSVLGENIAYNQGYDDPGAFAVERWMLSAGHRANILSVEFRAMSVGAFVAADGSVFITQTFITR
jgi:uncharacterized protein YkwD